MSDQESSLVPAGPFLVSASAQRPARMDGTCFYCSQPIGVAHKPSCVLIVKKVRVRMTVEYDIEVPDNWTKDNVEFHRNESSWCAGNMMSELEALGHPETGCLCGKVHFTYLNDVSGPFVNEE